jgi:hypothetical protein
VASETQSLDFQKPSWIHIEVDTNLTHEQQTQILCCQVKDAKVITNGSHGSFRIFTGNGYPSTTSHSNGRFRFIVRFFPPPFQPAPPRSPSTLRLSASASSASSHPTQPCPVLRLRLLVPLGLVAPNTALPSPRRRPEATSCFTLLFHSTLNELLGHGVELGEEVLQIPHLTLAESKATPAPGSSALSLSLSLLSFECEGSVWVAVAELHF